MAVEVKEVGNVLEVHVSQKLTKEDYEHFVPATEKKLEQGKLHILLVMQDFHGWELSALWEDIKFDVKHFKDIAKLALVGDKKWEAGMATFCKPFTTATVKYFDIAELEAARSWVAED